MGRSGEIVVDYDVGEGNRVTQHRICQEHYISSAKLVVYTRQVTYGRVGIEKKIFGNISDYYEKNTKTLQRTLVYFSGQETGIHARHYSDK